MADGGQMLKFTDPILAEWEKELHETTRDLLSSLSPTNDPLKVIHILDIDYNGGPGTYAGRDANRLRDMVSRELEQARELRSLFEFFDREMAERGFGTTAILRLVRERARALGVKVDG